MSAFPGNPQTRSRLRFAVGMRPAVMTKASTVSPFRSLASLDGIAVKSPKLYAASIWPMCTCVTVGVCTCVTAGAVQQVFGPA